MHGNIERNFVFHQSGSGSVSPFCKASRQRSSAFTLIELLVVILIISVLISILIPVVGYVKTQAKRASTTALLNSIGTGLESYYRDFNMYPPSNSTGAYSGALSSSGSNGGLMLAQGLNGYLDYNYDGAGPSNPSSATKDPAFGFRVPRKSQIYGPYANPSASTWHVQDPTHQYFTDLWGDEILYYRAIPTTANGTRRTVTSVFGDPFQAIFATDDNTKAFDTTHTEIVLTDPSTSTPFLNLLGATANNYAAGDVVAGKDSYLLVSAGPDLRFFVGDNAAAKPDDIISGGK